MTVSSQTSTATFVGNGVATAFPLPFRFFDNGDIRAYFIDSVTGAATQMALGTDYTLIGAGEPEVDGNALSLLTTTAPLASMRGLYVERVMPQVQETDIVNQGQFFASTHEDVFDRLTMLIQQANENSKGAIRVAIGDPEPARLAPAAQRANRLLGFDAQGQPFAVAPVSGSSADLAIMLADYINPENGASLVGYKGRYVSEVLGDKLNVKDYGATGDGVADETASLQAAIDELAASQGFQTTLGAVTGGYVSNVTTLVIPRGIYKISNSLVCPAYFKVVGDNAIIIQTNAAKDIFANPTTAYQWEIEGVHFSGGRCHANMGNDNVDVTRWTFRSCTFGLSSSYAVRTFPVGGASSHLSANLLIKDCAFYKPKKLLLNFCDSATVEDCWVFVSKDNFDPSTAVFENGSLTCDGYPNLYMRGMFGVPSMGTHGVDRLVNVRWCDLFKGGISVDRCRFGGEFAGMPVVYNLAANNPAYPFLGPAVTIHNSECFGGPSAAADSGVVSLQAQIPARISIHNCLGPVEVPYITNAGNQIADIPAYFAAYELASGQKAYTRYNFDIRGNSSLAPDGSVYGVRVPADMRPYCNDRRQTKVRRAATQVLANAFSSNIASFDTVDFDSQGGFSIANPTRIVMPAGATSMRIQAHFSLDGGWTGNTLRAAIVDSSLAVVTGQGFASNVNADDTQYTISADVFGSPGDWWAFEIKHNAVAAQNMIKCTVTTSALDYIS